MKTEWISENIKMFFGLYIIVLGLLILQGVAEGFIGILSALIGAGEIVIVFYILKTLIEIASKYLDTILIPQWLFVVVGTVTFFRELSF